MKKIALFIGALFLNGGLFAALNYALEPDKNWNKVLFNFIFFGIFMAIIQVIILPKFSNKNKK
ncbi:MAG: hypothetical protein MUF43_01630 [Flavobacterium sp.]|nr:hypothetical protein [Flavobacterium sp.]